MNKKEREFCKKVMLGLNKEFRMIFNERMDHIRGNDKIINKEILKDIESYRGNMCIVKMDMIYILNYKII